MNMIEKRKAMAGQGGFTLIELLVVIAILAILAGAAVIGIGAMRSNAQKQVCKTDKATLETAAEAWAVSTESNNLVATQADLKTAGYIKATNGNFGNPTRAGANDPFVATGSGKCAGV